MWIWAYVVENAAWSLGGLGLGYLLGRTERNIRSISKDVHDDDDT